MAAPLGGPPAASRRREHALLGDRLSSGVILDAAVELVDARDVELVRGVSITCQAVLCQAGAQRGLRGHEMRFGVLAIARGVVFVPGGGDEGFTSLAGRVRARSTVPLMSTTCSLWVRN